MLHWLWWMYHPNNLSAKLKSRNGGEGNYLSILLLQSKPFGSKKTNKYIRFWQDCNSANKMAWTNNDALPCSDGVACTRNDRCSGGGCSGTSFTCLPCEECYNDACSVKPGYCVIQDGGVKKCFTHGTLRPAVIMEIDQHFSTFRQNYLKLLFISSSFSLHSPLSLRFDQCFFFCMLLLESPSS